MKFINFIDAVKQWGEECEFVKAVILVGSYARGTNKADSDIDLCILSDNKSYIVSSPDIFNQFGSFSKFDIEYYGACTSIRVWYDNGLEVEYGIVDESWISKPLDSGTNQVLHDGYKVIVDKKDYFKDIELV